METMNKWLIVLVFLCIAIRAYVIVKAIDGNVVTIHPFHPYNECIKIIVDQANKENGKCDFDKAKSVCFELLSDKNKKD